jgi:hypothetical protein
MPRSINVHKLAIHNARGFLIAFPNLGRRIGFPDEGGCRAVILESESPICMVPVMACIWTVE